MKWLLLIGVGVGLSFLPIWRAGTKSELNVWQMIGEFYRGIEHVPAEWARREAYYIYLENDRNH